MSAKFNAKLISLTAKAKVSNTDFLIGFFDELVYLELPLHPFGCYVPVGGGHYEIYCSEHSFAEDAAFVILNKGFVKFRDEAGNIYELRLRDLVTGLVLLPFVFVGSFDRLYNSPEMADWRDSIRLLQFALFGAIRYDY